MVSLKNFRLKFQEQIRVTAVGRMFGHHSLLSTRSLRYGSKVSLKTILKGIGSGIINDIWDYILKPLKILQIVWHIILLIFSLFACPFF